jgi:glyoxylase-like metal-dependent hydrolase (beta-lactamase superfamily II)
MLIHRFINDIFASNTYLLLSDKTEEAWIIDPGNPLPVHHRLQESGKTLQGIFITHSHFDHIYGINELQRNYPKSKVFASENSLAGLFSAKLNMSKYHDLPYCVERRDVISVCGGAQIALGADLCMKVIETPGHHPGCLSFQIGDELFTGDALIPGIGVVTILPGGDRVLAKKSVELILNWFDNTTRIWPGHGESCPLEEIDGKSYFKNK